MAGMSSNARPSIPGSQGKTIEDALANIRDAIQGCLDVLNEKIELKAHQTRRLNSESEWMILSRCLL
jgi:predicted RNase H-like HicB family nuclease